MFSAKMNESKVLKGMIEAVSALIDETYFVADEKGLTLTAMDESHICLMSMDLPKEIFTGGYTCAEQVKMGVNLEDLSKIMKRAAAADAVEFTHKPDGEKFGVVMKGTGTRTFNTRLVEIDEEKIPPVAELDVLFGARATFDVSVLEEAVKDAEIYQDTLEITLTKDGLKMAAAGEVGDIEYLLTQDHLDALDVTTERVDKDSGKTLAVPVARGVFSLAFLKNILKISAITDKVTLHVAENAPMKLEFEITLPDLPAKGRVVYFMAPRVEEAESYESD
jgi:proliferating cell nuclear antigen